MARPERLSELLPPVVAVLVARHQPQETDMTAPASTLTVGDYSSATCPMPDCHGVLHLERTGTYGISVGDLRLREPVHHDDDHSSS